MCLIKRRSNEVYVEDMFVMRLGNIFLKLKRNPFLSIDISSLHLQTNYYPIQTNVSTFSYADKSKHRAR